MRIRITCCLLLFGNTCIIVAQVNVPQVSRRPNVIIIAIDTLRSDHLGCYGYQRDVSPNIDKLAAEGVLFEQCYSVASWTLPAFMSIFTGLMPAIHECTYSGSSPLSDAIPTLPKQFKKQGYYCSAIVSNPLLNGKYGFKRGFDVYDDYSIFLDAEMGLFAADTNKERGIVNEIVTGETVTQQAISQLICAKKTGNPFFLFVLYFDPHDSYLPPVPFNKKYDYDYQGNIDGRGVTGRRNKPPQGRDLQHLIALYDGEIAYTDFVIGKLLQKIDEICDPDNTLTILVSDHGEAFAEHGKLLHANNTYREELCVPMIWRWPGVISEGHRVKTPVSNLDIPKTLNELFKFENINYLQGESLWAGLRGKKFSQVRPVFSQRANGDYSQYLFSLTMSNLRYHITFKDDINQADHSEIYDIYNDPGEKTNIFALDTPQFDAMNLALSKKWAECNKIREQYRQKKKKGKIKMNQDEIKRLKSLGYLNSGDVSEP